MNDRLFVLNSIHQHQSYNGELKNGHGLYLAGLWWRKRGVENVMITGGHWVEKGCSRACWYSMTKLLAGVIRPAMSPFSKQGVLLYV